jgi:hypothetical protein
MAYHEVVKKKHRGDVPLRQSWGGCTVAASATLPLCHDWTGVVDLSPHVFAYKYRGSESKKKEKEKRKKAVGGDRNERKENRGEKKTEE